MNHPMTPMLEELIEHAKKACGKDGGLSAERFLLVSLEAARGTLPLTHADKDVLERMRSSLRAAGISSSSRRNALSCYIRGDNSPIEDSIAITKLLYGASAAAKAAGQDKLSPDILVQHILENPTRCIKELLNTGGVSSRMQSSLENLLRSSAGSSNASTDESIGDPRLDTQLDSLFASLFDTQEPATPDKQEEQKPSSSLSAIADLTRSVKEKQKQLLEQVFGQDNAVSTFISGYFQGELANMTDKKRVRPRATFLFAGPPGVGKTFLAQQGAKVLGLPFARFDMSEYSDKEANIEFCGSDKVYKNGKAGNVTSFVAENPHCVLLFDEIEKAHLCVIHLFLQMLDAGRLRDNFTDKEVSFKDTIIILTTNAGRQLYDESETGDFSCLSRKVILKALQKDVNADTGAPFFPAAICSRFATGNVVMFNHIGAHGLRAIAKKEVLRHSENFQKETGIDVQIQEDVFTALLFAEGGAADARTICGRAEAFFDTELFELFRLMASDNAGKSIEDIRDLSITVQLPEDDKKITELFHGTTTPNALVFSDEAMFRRCESGSDACLFQNMRDPEQALQILRKQDIRLVLIDPAFGRRESCTTRLNAEDRDSVGRDLLFRVRTEYPDVPVYLLQPEASRISPEERLSFLRMGVRDILTPDETFHDTIREVCTMLHQNESMHQLARSNRIISFETAQQVSQNGTHAVICLFDFKSVTAVDAEDSGNLLSALSRPDVHFEQVIGADEAKKELQYFVEYLKDPKKYLGTGVSAPKGVILYGPPGTGKTLLAKAMACESEATFIAAEGNQFLQKFQGEGKEKVHELFRTARKYAPAILFVDEIDAIAKERRGGEQAGSNGEDVLTAFLTEMDGFKSDPSKPVFVLAATNFDVEPGSPKSLDAALMRRFDRRILVDLPNKEDRIRYLNMKLASKPIFRISAGQIENLAVRSTGMSLAGLESVLELALRTAIRNGETAVTDDILENAFELFHNGEEKKWDLSQLERVARHEAGHAYLCWHSGETPSYLTIVARGNHGGYMQHGDREGKAIYTRQELLANIRTSLAGRAAEIVCYGEEDGISTGASGDLSTATRTARHMLCTYGMDESFGLATVEPQTLQGSNLSDRIHEAVNRLLAQQMEQTIQILTEGRAALDALVSALMEKTSLTGTEISAILDQK